MSVDDRLNALMLVLSGLLFLVLTLIALDRLITYWAKTAERRQEKLPQLFAAGKYEQVLRESMDMIYLMPLRITNDDRNNPFVEKMVNNWAGTTNDLLSYASRSAAQLSLDNEKFEAFVTLVHQAKRMVWESYTYGTPVVSEAEWQQMQMDLIEARLAFDDR